MFRKTLIALAIGAAALSLAACNTVRGVGADLKSVADAGEDVMH